MTKLKTVNIKGKEYVEVNERIKHFRSNYKDWALSTTILELDNNRCVIQATVFNENDRIISTGIAYEVEGSSFINKTSFIENCETSAIGRALGNLGIGIDTSVASYEEVANAIKQQSAPKTKEALKWKRYFKKTKGYFIVNNPVEALDKTKGKSIISSSMTPKKNRS